MKANKWFTAWASVWGTCIILTICFYILPNIDYCTASAIQIQSSSSDIIFQSLPIESTSNAQQYFSIAQDLSDSILYQEYQIFYPLSDYERWLVESIVAGESGIEPYWGKVAVASCILNACLLEDKRPEEIQTMYGYAGWKPIEEFESECMEAYGNTDLADEVHEAVSQVFDRGEVLSNEILWFCSGYSEWHEGQRFVIEISNHRFFAPWG